MKKYIITTLSLAAHLCFAMEKSPEPLTKNIIRDEITLHQHILREISQPFQSNTGKYFILSCCLNSTAKCSKAITALGLDCPIDEVNLRYKELIKTEKEKISQQLIRYIFS